MVLVDLTGGGPVENPQAALLTLLADAGERQLIAAASGPGPLAVRFDKFNDGRGLTIARLLREWHGFRGEIRATGHLIPDLAPHLARSGFDTAELADGAEIETWKHAIGLAGAYQVAWRDPAPMRRKAAASEAAALDERLAGLPSLEERVVDIGSAVAGRIAFSTSLGEEDQAIYHAIAETGANIDVFTLDTGRLFEETLETLEASRLRYGVPIRVVTPHAHELEELIARDGVFGFRQTVAKRKACCEIRKVRPLARALRGAGGWITGLRRDQSGARAAVPFAAWDGERALLKLNPLADWPLEALRAYIEANDIPVNPLHVKGFPSIGCQPCTRAIAPGEDIRAGRWWWESEDRKECGLHVEGAAGRRGER